ncbi:MAG: YkgJ family cysteine cluster protein [Bacteroidales bacterium]|nr:YkgJ family cysteine cluster protein [Bacteroidales bacterium]
MHCREHCGACCIAPSISSPIPGMPNGKPPGVPCIHLDEDFRCTIFDRPERPAVCSGFLPEPCICGTSREEALAILRSLEEGELD